MSKNKQHIIQFILENRRKHGNLFIDFQEVLNNYSLEEIKDATISLYKSQMNIENFDELSEKEKFKKICEYADKEISEEVKQRSNIEFLLGMMMKNVNKKQKRKMRNKKEVLEQIKEWEKERKDPTRSNLREYTMDIRIDTANWILGLQENINDEIDYFGE